MARKRMFSHHGLLKEYGQARYRLRRVHRESEEDNKRSIDNIRRFATRLEFVCKNNQIIKIWTDKRRLKIRYAEKNQSIPVASVQAVVLVRRRAQQAPAARIAD
jgi:hypothetical protein